jgi:uncharacterized iron-regulated membrane protein
MRRVFVWLHRYVGLAMALFLIIEGLTGSLLAFDAEIKSLLDPRLSATKPSPDARPLDPATLIERAEAALPGATVGYFMPRFKEDQVVLRMAWKPGEAPDDGEPDVLLLDPWTGKELGRRPFHEHWAGDFPRDAMPFIYMLHKDLALGGLGGWLLSVVALLWTLDCFGAFYLTLPITRKDFWRRWKSAWLVKWRGGFFRVNFDLHRAGGLWLFAMLFVFAWSSVHLSGGGFGIYDAMTDRLFGYDLNAMIERLYPPHPDDGPPRLDLRAAQARGERLAEEIAAREGFRILRPISMQYIPYAGRYNLSVLTDRGFPQDRRLTVFFDSNSGELGGLAQSLDSQKGLTITNWLRALHMIRDPVDYLPYRIFVCVIGLVVAMLSVTGVYVWWKKRRARRFHAQHQDSRAASTAREAALSRTHSQPSDA